ncbi:hypothetical protein L7F22_060985 [Adiantum nelumboides]|nr:hypothetical protein [Adiantum nelumboides]
MMETIVKLGDVDEPVLALVDHGLHINLMSKSLHQNEKWPNDVDHGLQIQVANMLLGDFYGTCTDVKVTIGDVCDILGKPYITVVHMETKVLDDGLAYARIQSRDGKRAINF